MDTDLQLLMDLWFGEEEADESVLNRLSRRLREEPEFRHGFVSEILMHGKLRAVQSPEPRWHRLNDLLDQAPDASAQMDFEERVMQQFDALGTQPKALPATPIPRVAWWLIALSAVLLTWAVVRQVRLDHSASGSGRSEFGTDHEFSHPLDDGISPLPAVSYEPVALIRRGTQATWQSDEPLRNGDRIPARTLKIEDGIAQIDFFGGASLVMRGPAEIDVLSSRSAHLKAGRISGRVTELGRGFRLHTPAGTLADEGSAFVLAVEPSGSTEVHLIEGTARFEEVSLTAGAAIAADAGAIETIPYAPEGFPHPDEFERRSEQRTQHQYQNWLNFSKALSEDPDTLLHYRMVDGAPRGPELRNDAAEGNANRAAHGTILGAQWVAGRWREKRALHFSHEADRVLTKLPGAFENLTFLIWSKVDALTQPHSALLLAEMPGRWALNGALPPQELEAAIARRKASESQVVRWLAHRSSQLSFNVGITGKRDTPLEWERHMSQQKLLASSRWGQWHCHAVTYDTSARQVIHYFDGKASGRSTLTRPAPLMLDYLEIGNLSTGEAEKQQGVQYRFYGAMDEIFVAKRAYTPEEMAEIYEIGRP